MPKMPVLLYASCVWMSDARYLPEILLNDEVIWSAEMTEHSADEAEQVAIDRLKTVLSVLLEES